MPADVSICGFDNLESVGLPKLTSIDWPFEAMGKVAVRRLMRRIENPSATPVSQFFHGALVRGQTTGPAQRRD